MRSATNAEAEEPEGDWGFDYNLRRKVKPFARLLLMGAASVSVTNFHDDEANYPGFWDEVFRYLAVRAKQVARAKKMVQSGGQKA